jgi:mono/diheme cytochrome c family protein
MRSIVRFDSFRMAAPLIVAGLLTAGVGCTPAGNETEGPLTGEALAERGAYLVTTGACGDCHTPWRMGAAGPEPDSTRHLSGHPEGVVITSAPEPDPGIWMWSGAATMTAFAGPWGVSFAANLTPDEATGIGAWTEEMFVQGLRTGKHWGRGRDILPPMPWQAYAHFTDEDLRAIFAYLNTLDPIINRVPPPVPPAGPPPGAPGATGEPGATGGSGGE